MRLRLACVAMLVPAVVSGPAFSAPTAAVAPAPPNAALLTAIKACEQPSRVLLEQVVAIDSGTGDAAGLKSVATLFASELKALGANVRLVAPAGPSVGDNVVASLTGQGRGRILLIAHMDTVFSRGDVAKWPPHWEGEHYVGPGAGDDKSGGVTAVCVLGALKTIGYTDFARIDLLLNASEETGSAGSRDLIRTMARASDLVINLERGVPTDKALVGRKGAATLIVTISDQTPDF